MSYFSTLNIGQYYPGDSVLHRTDSRVKLGLVIFFTVVIFLIKNFLAFGLITAGLGFLILLGRLPVRMVIRGLRPLVYILLFTVVIHIWLTAGPTLQVGPVAVSKEGLRTGAFVSLRLILLVIGTSLLTLTSTPVEITDALEYLLGPLKRLGLPAHELAMMMTIALRFIPTLAAEAEKVIKAQMARGVDFETGPLLKRLRNFVPILIPLFVGVFRQADELAMAMEARGYRGGENRTRLRELKMDLRDWLAAIVVSGILIVIGFAGRLPSV